MGDNRVQPRLKPDTIRVLRQLGQLSGVSADLVAQRLLEDLTPELEKVIKHAEELHERADPAGRGYIAWAINIPHVEPGDEPSYQPSGAYVALHVGTVTGIAGHILRVSPATDEEAAAREGFLISRNTRVRVFSNAPGEEDGDGDERYLIRKPQEAQS